MGKIRKFKTKHTDNQEVKNQTDSQETMDVKESESTTKNNVKKSVLRAVGVFLLGASISIYVQALPLVFVFLGGYMRLPSDGSATIMDLSIWILTCVGILIPSIYVFIVWMKFVWQRFVRNPQSFTLFSKKA